MTTDPGDLVFDPTSGSGTTAYVAEQRGRRWITCDTARVPLALARQRIFAGLRALHGGADGTGGAVGRGPDRCGGPRPGARGIADMAAGVYENLRRYLDRMIEVLRKGHTLRLPGNASLSLANVRALSGADHEQLHAEAVEQSGSNRGAIRRRPETKGPPMAPQAPKGRGIPAQDSALGQASHRPTPEGA